MSAPVELALQILERARIQRIFKKYSKELATILLEKGKHDLEEDDFLESQKEYGEENNFYCDDCSEYSTIDKKCKLNDTQEFCKVIKARETEKCFYSTHEQTNVGLGNSEPAFRRIKDENGL